jgi:hypothetical protein
MKNVGRSDAITSIGHELYRSIVHKVNAGARNRRVAENVIPVRQLEGGENAIGWTKDTTFKLVKPDRTTGPTPTWARTLGRDERGLGVVEADVGLHFVYDGFYISPEALAASRMGSGRSIDLRTQITIAIDVADEQEKMLWRGIDDPEVITGIDEGATDGGASAGAWSTRANVITDLETLVTGVRSTANWTGPRFLVVTSPLMTDMMIRENDYTDRVVLDTVQRLFPLGIYETGWLESTETALVGAPGAEGEESELANFEIVRAAPTTTWLAPDEFGKGVKGLVFSKMSPKIYQSTALYEIDNITA